MSYNDIQSRLENLSARVVSENSIFRKLSRINKRRVYGDYFEFINGLEKNLKVIDQFEEAEVRVFNSYKTYIDVLHNEIITRHKELVETFNNYLSELDNKKIQIVGKKNELRQKLSLLKNKDSDYKLILEEQFYNLFNISSITSEYESMNIDVESEVATLPIVSESQIVTNKIYISNYSNCIPGNYESKENKFIYSIVDKNKSTVFEAFKEGEGPLKLGITISFLKEEIVNKIVLEELSTEAEGTLEIEDIKFNQSNSKSISIRGLVNYSEQSFFSNSEGLVSIVHLPVKCTSVSFKIKSLSNFISSGDNYYTIGLKSLKFFKQQYGSSGRIRSTSYSLPSGYYSIDMSEKFFPILSKGFSLNKSISVDNGLEFKPVFNQSLVTDGKEKQVIYSYTFERNTEEFSKGVTIKNQDYFVDVDKKTTRVNKGISPNELEIPFDYFLENSFRVVQNKLLTRSTDYEKRTVLGYARSTGRNSFNLPIKLTQLEDSEINVFLGATLLTRVSSLETLVEEGQYCIVDHKQLVVLITRDNVFLEVSCLLNPYFPIIQKKQEGYYLRVNESFDFDPNELSLKTYVSESSKQTQVFSNIRENTLSLHYGDVIISSLKIFKYENDDFVEVTEGFEVLAEEGLISLDNELVNLNLKIEYKYYITASLNKDDYEIWSVEENIKGIFIYPEKMAYQEVTDNIFGIIRIGNFDIGSIFNNQSWTQDIYVTNTAGKKFFLSENNIISGTLKLDENVFENYREVQFVDGITEHLNLKQMQRDYIPRIQKNNLGIVSFSLQYKPYVNSLFSSKVRLFKDDVEVLDIEDRLSFDVENRLATLELLPDEEVSEGYYLSYSYIGEPKDYDSYSVDYQRGVVYFSKDIARVDVANISYKVARVRVEYNIVKNIENFELNLLDRNVKVFTEEFLSINNNLKFLAFKNKNQFNFEGLEEFLSPIVYSLKIGLS